MRTLLTPLSHAPARLAASAALLVLLFLAPRASAASEYDGPAYDYLAAGAGYAADAGGTVEGYYAALYAEYAAYYAGLAYDLDEPIYWFYAESLAASAYEFALADFFATGNVWSLYAAYYCYYGSGYAADAYDYFR
jgi:hypothetical protein